MLVLDLQQQVLQHHRHLFRHFLDPDSQFLVPLGPVLDVIESIFVILTAIQVLNQSLNFGQALLHLVARVQSDYLVKGLIVINGLILLHHLLREVFQGLGQTLEGACQLKLEVI